MPVRGSPCAAALVAAALAGCGSRTGLVIGEMDAGTLPPAGSCGPGGLSLAGTALVEAATPDQEPESKLVLAWTGSELILGWARWTATRYVHAVAPVQVSSTGLAVGPATTSDVGNTSNPFNLSGTWDGSALALFWAQDDGSILLEHFGSDGAARDGTTVVVAPTGTQTIASNVLSRPDGYLLVWSAQTDSGWNTLASPLDRGGIPTARASLLYAGSGYDLGASLTTLGAAPYALWSTHPQTDPTSPVTTTVASLDPATGTVQTMATVDEGVDHDPTSIAVEPHSRRIDVVSWLPDTDGAVIFGGIAGGRAFAARATLEGVTDSPALAVDACGRLAVLTPVGMMSADNPLATGLTMQLVADDGTLGAPVTLPVGGSYLESFEVVAVDGGFAVAWIEGGSDTSQPPNRSLHVAYVRSG
jgi:hypothetical protein